MGQVHRTAVIARGVKVGRDVFIGPHCTIGFPSHQCRIWPDGVAKTTIGSGTVIMGNVVLCRGTQIGANCRIDYHVFVGEGTSIGEYCVLEYGARIYDGVRVSDCATVSGFIANGCQIGSQSIVQGQLVHRFADVSIEDVEPSPIVGEACFVGMGSLIVGPIRIADRTYVAAGAIVTQSTRAGMMYRGAPANEVGTAPLAYREGTAAFNRVSMERIHESIRRGSWA